MQWCCVHVHVRCRLFALSSGAVRVAEQSRDYLVIHSHHHPPWSVRLWPAGAAPAAAVPSRSKPSSISHRRLALVDRASIYRRRCRTPRRGQLGCLWNHMHTRDLARTYPTHWRQRRRLAVQRLPTHTQTEQLRSNAALLADRLAPALLCSRSRGSNVKWGPRTNLSFITIRWDRSRVSRVVRWIEQPATNSTYTAKDK